MLNVNNSFDVFWVFKKPTKNSPFLFQNLKKQNWRIQNSKNKDSNFSNENLNKIDDNSMVGQNPPFDKNINFNLDKSSDKPVEKQQVNFKKIDQNSFGWIKDPSGLNYSKKNNKFNLNPIQTDFWSKSVKEGGENRKLRVRTNFSRAVEKIGLIPRSIIRTSDRFRKQLFPGTETLLLQEFRISRYQILVSLKCLLALIFIPLTVHFLTKNLILTPLIEYLWNNNKNDIFLNSTQQEQALNELQDFENEIYFELLVAPTIGDNNKNIEPFSSKNEEQRLKNHSNDVFNPKMELKEGANSKIQKISNYEEAVEKQNLKAEMVSEIPTNLYVDKNKLEFNKIVIQKQEFQEKTVALAIKYNQQSIDSLIRLTSDFITVLTLIGVILVMKAEIIILKSFLIETVYSFNDTTKSFLIIFITDLLVGFHSSPGWELFFQSILNRFGLPFTETSILLTVAIVPVFLDTLFKYWIFRYLNKISPTTVATLNAMRE